MRTLCLLGLIFLTACFSRTTLMTRETFDSISLGTPISEVVAKAGEPYSIHSKGGGLEEYEYHERLAIDNQFVAEYHYFLKVSQGKVVAKRVVTEKEPAYDLIYQEDPNYPYIPLK